MNVRLVLPLLLILIGPVYSTNAQTVARLTGSLSDPSGASVSKAVVTATSLENSARTAHAVSGPDGRFTLELAPGRYRVKIVRASFENVEEEFNLAPGETHEWNARMQLARLAATVVVSAEAQPTPAENVPAPVDILTHEDIEQRQENWLAPLLTSNPGASLARLGSFGGITSLFLDGGNSNFTKVLIDGAPVNQPGGDVDFSNFDLLDVEKVEVVHGAASALFGSDAMTGVVQIFTHRGTTRIPEIELVGDGGTYSSGRGSARISGLLDRFDYSASASYFSTDGQGPNDRFRDTSLSGNFGWRFTDTDTLRLTVRNSSSDAGQPGQTLLVPPDPDQQADLHNFTANLAWDFSTGEHWHYHLDGIESYIHQIYGDPDDFTDINQFNRAGFNAQSSYLYRGGAVSFGYDYEVENGSPNGPHVRRNNQAGYLETNNRFGKRLTVTAGGRAEANGSFGTRVVPRGGVAYALRFGNGFWGPTRLRFSYGQGIKEPNFVQSFENDPCFPGNPNLKPERSDTLDAGIEQYAASNRLRFSLDYFHNTFYDVVSFFGGGPPTTMCPFGTGTFFNTDKSRAFGARATIEARPLRWLRILGNYTYDDTRVLQAPNIFDPTQAPGNRLERRPLHSANLIFNAAFRRMNWNLAGYYVGRRTDSDFLFPPLGITSDPPYVRWDIATSYDFGRGFTALAHIENLFNKRYQDAVGYPALGLNYRLGMKYTWGGESLGK
ncbi:MAG TPA: TonB-dependent receptor [Candidatus Acidoferrales bacterium]|jgi:outer membrane cobalamin receptor|nr:TonB-dependent receptor [Candidatus Acidoferrales bacterium]